MPSKRRRPIATAPRDGTRLRLFGLREPVEFVASYSEKYFGWVGLHEITCPLVRHDVTHWSPIE